MTSREFCYWLQGFFENREKVSPDELIQPAQVASIRKHLNLVFVHEIDPSYPNADKLNAIHNPVPAHLSGKTTPDGTKMRC